MAKPGVETLLDLILRSGLVEKDHLQALVSRIESENGGKLPDDVDKLAERFVAENLITPWQRDRFLEGRYRGFFLGRYKLLGQVGSGGMSMVYLGEHVLMHRRVAIKVLPKGRVNDTSYLARFQREAREAASLDHPNIVRVYDFDNEGDMYYLVMEYVEGRDLQQTIKKNGRLDYAQAADYIRQAAEGLGHAHLNNLIHRDVKPANLLLIDQKNIVKVLDLGLARFTNDEQASLTVQYDENVLGTADYLAPEQAVDSHGVDARADIYSLGCALYFLLTGHPPFPEGTLPQRLMAHQKQQPPPIAKERPGVPADLEEICRRMMAKKPNDRYQSMADVAEDLRRWLVDYDGGSSPSGRLGGTPPLAKRLTHSGPVPQLRDSTGALPRAVAEAPAVSPSFHETLADSDRSTTPSISRRNPDSNISDLNLRGKSLRKATPLSSRGSGPISLDDVLSSSAKSGPMKAVAAKPSASGPIKAAEAKPTGRRKKGPEPSKWVWLGIGLILVISVAVIVLVFMMRK